MNRNPAITPPSTTTGAPTEAARFVPGHVLAGRYRRIARLGKGGMGEVWRADDLVLETQVALKLIYSADAEARKVILDEVRLARQITHPAICRVFDVGEGPGEVFYSMELVHGEDLATLVRRMGRLPGEKIAILSAALRWDLLPRTPRASAPRSQACQRPLSTRKGGAHTDFGIAISLDAAHNPSLIGTPRYMAPQNSCAGNTADAQTTSTPSPDLLRAARRPARE